MAAELKDNVFEKIKREVINELKFCSAHKFDHVQRVYNLCMQLAQGENVDMEVLKAAAYLHDIGGKKEIDDKTGSTDHAIVGSELAEKILIDLGFPKDKIQHVKDCIISHRFKTKNKPQSMEAKILFDADKIDAIGAIGLARGFAWIGSNNGNIYYKPAIEEYRKDNLGENGRIKDKSKHSPQIEFEIKLKHLQDRLFTKKGRGIGKERVKFSKNYLDRLEKEINGKL